MTSRVEPLLNKRSNERLLKLIKSRKKELRNIKKTRLKHQDDMMKLQFSLIDEESRRRNTSDEILAADRGITAIKADMYEDMCQFEQEKELLEEQNFNLQRDISSLQGEIEHFKRYEAFIESITPQVWKEYVKRRSIKEAVSMEATNQRLREEEATRARKETRESIVRTEEARIADCFKHGKLPGKVLSEADIDQLVEAQMNTTNTSSFSTICEGSSVPARVQSFFKDSQEVVDAMRQVQSEITALISMAIDLTRMNIRAGSEDTPFSSPLKAASCRE